MGRGGGAAAGGDLLTSQHRGVEGDESGYCELPGDAAAAAVIPRATVPQQHPSPHRHTPPRGTHTHPTAPGSAVVSGGPGRGAPPSDSSAPGRPGAGEVWEARSLRPLGRWACALFYSACSLPAAAAVASGGWGSARRGSPGCQLGRSCLPSPSAAGHGRGERWEAERSAGAEGASRGLGIRRLCTTRGRWRSRQPVGAHMYADRCAGAR